MMTTTTSQDRAVWDTEEFAKQYCKIDELVEPDDVNDVVYFLRRTPKLPFMTCDSVGVFSEILGDKINGKPISVACAVAIMNAVESRHNTDRALIIVAQKWCVMHCFTPWILHHSEHQGRFSVGLCYYGNYGDAPPTMQHIPHFVHKHPQIMRK